MKKEIEDLVEAVRYMAGEVVRGTANTEQEEQGKTAGIVFHQLADGVEALARENDRQAILLRTSKRINLIEEVNRMQTVISLQSGIITDQDSVLEQMEDLARYYQEIGEMDDRTLIPGNVAVEIREVLEGDWDGKSNL